MNTIGKAWHVMGYTLNGEYYCTEHATKFGAQLGGRWNGEDVAPVFASDDYAGLSCLFCE